MLEKEEETNGWKRRCQELEAKLIALEATSKQSEINVSVLY